jgi:hypothetical protein
MKVKAREYHGVVATFNVKLGEIAFPVAAQPVVAEMRELTASESAGLKELADIDVKDTDRIGTVRSRVEANDASVTLRGDELRAALGHPEPQAFVAADGLEAAYRAFYNEIAPVSQQFESALAHNDLNGAKAANAIEEHATQRYLDRLGTIDWPMGYEDEVNTLRSHLREMIDFDHKQVDVASTAQIVKAPEDGLPAAVAADEAEVALYYKLSDLGNTLRPDRNC